MPIDQCEGPGCTKPVARQTRTVLDGNGEPFRDETARRRLYCSDKCSAAAKASRRRASRPLRTKTCSVCGELFVTRDARQTMCEGDGYLLDGSPTPCQALRNIAANPKAFANTQQCQAHGCDRRTGDRNAQTTGRPKRFCSDRCRKRAFAASKRGESK